ncbi:hypothetical protein SAMN02746062_01109 [Alysiella filiformis DSM 16848]|uniref:Regulatory protein, RpfE type n=2 Tax=Alysiella TaxID=194195 RepID=A0A286EAW7_9NEIS|nr:hypothetical protein SAMN02746062_01109 [Alysiella filiformis DSM 16848]
MTGMFTLILPTLSRPTSAHLPPLNLLALNEMWRFGTWLPHDLTTGQIYLRYLCGKFALPENEVFASPVWLQMGMNNMTMIDGASIQIGMGEAQSLCDGLNEFYRHDFALSPIRADLWRFRLPEKPQWQSPMLFDAWGFQAGDLSEQASGQNRNAWLQLQTEIQMWLHAHPMNKVRQKNGLSPINGIWLWNAPTHETLQHQPQLIGSSSTWANATTLPLHDAPYSFTVWQQICQEKNLPLGETALFLDDLTTSAQTGDEFAYHRILQQWETHFFAPIWSALKSGTLPEMRLICEQGILHIKQRAHWAFWKRAKNFTGQFE